MIYLFDLDNTLCSTERSDQGYWLYRQAMPILSRIDVVNRLYSEGHYIIVDTARGCNSGEDWYDFTFAQLREWGLQFNELRTGVKKAADLYIDDKAINSESFFSC